MFLEFTEFSRASMNPKWVMYKTTSSTWKGHSLRRSLHKDLGRGVVEVSREKIV